MTESLSEPAQVQTTLLAHDETLLSVASDSEAQATAPPPIDFKARYQNERELGRGGMGVVDLASDLVIGRRVALKRARLGEGTDRRELRRRFMREARVQGQLEHPSIVPVYDFGVSPDGEAYFTMKRVDGITLEEVILRLAANEPEAKATYTARRLLESYARVCLTVDFAHTRGVVHRDLKPANVMLGAFGEVYVLDWGIARILRDDRDTVRTVNLDALEDEDQVTVTGGMLGTPGYMAPEQISDIRVAASADVYALGAILFEILTLQTLNRGRGLKSRVVETLSGVDARARARAPAQEIAPELEELCVRATALAASARPASARALSDAIGQHLDGQRNLALRKELAASHLASATASLARDPSPTERRAALRAIGHAIALDSDNTEALRTMVRLISEPPATIPPEVDRDLLRLEQREVQRAGWVAAAIYASALLYVPMLMWMGVRTWWPILAFLGIVVSAAVACVLISRRSAPDPRLVLIPCALSCIAYSFVAGFFGPLLFLPSVLSLNASGYANSVRGARLFSVVGLTLLSIAVPLALSGAGVLPPSYELTGAGTIVVHSWFLALEPIPTLALLGITTVTLLAGGLINVRQAREATIVAQRALLLQTWQLRQILPEAVNA